jgi:hypothetical protein
MAQQIQRGVAEDFGDFGKLAESTKAVVMCSRTHHPTPTRAIFSRCVKSPWRLK